MGLNSRHDFVQQERSLISRAQPRTQALCVVLCLARPLRGPRGLVKIALNPSQPDSRIPTIFVSNIRSIAPKIDELECVVNQNDSDIVCITETWLSDEIPDNAVAMHGFTLFRKDVKNAAEV
jgi:hypothetical protein